MLQLYPGDRRDDDIRPSGAVVTFQTLGVHICSDVRGAGGRGGAPAARLYVTGRPTCRAGPVMRPTLRLWAYAPRKADQMPLRSRRATALALVTVALAVAGCGAAAATPSAAPSVAANATPTNGLAAIACSTDDPEDVGALTGAWRGDDAGVYYIRQVGDCVWWFGTDLAALSPSKMGQSGFANVAAGRVDGTDVELEWADLTLGNLVGGGGLTFKIGEGGDKLEVAAQRGAWGFGAKTLRRIGANPSASATP